MDYTHRTSPADKAPIFRLFNNYHAPQAEASKEGREKINAALAALEPIRHPIMDALARLHALPAQIAAIEGLLSDAYQLADLETSLHTADEIPFMSEDGLQSFDVVNELRRAIWQFSQAINKPALDHAITAVQLAELHSDFSE